LEWNKGKLVMKVVIQFRSWRDYRKKRKAKNVVEGG